MRNILILILIILIGVSMGITKFSPEDVTALKERLWRMEQDIKNLKMENKVYFSDATRAKWIDWTPTYGALEPMTFTDVTTVKAKYCIIDKVVFFMINVFGTTGGTPSEGITFTLPLNYAQNLGGACWVYDNGRLGGIWEDVGSPPNDLILVAKYDYSNWNLGASKIFRIQGFYKMAE